MKDLLIINGHVMDSVQGIHEKADIMISNGRIKLVNQHIPNGGCDVIDAAGMTVCAGFIDLHCHLREPGQENKETVATGTRAAAAGGFTTLCAMPNTIPPMDNRIVAAYLEDVIRRDSLVRVLPIGCISRGRKGEELADMAELAAAGVVGFSDDGSPVRSTRLMRRALEYSLALGLPVIDHCEDSELAEGTQINEGIVATRLGLSGAPASAEEIIVARDIILAEQSGARLHIAHVSSTGSVELIRQAKIRGVKVTAEVTPHHLTLTENEALGYNTLAKVNPPLRTERDIDGLIEGLLDGTIDAIATDHAPHTEAEKACEFPLAAMGISGLETAFGSLMKLVHAGRLPLALVVAKLTSGPAQVLGKKYLMLGRLAIGSPADVTILDPAREWTVDADKFLSKGKNTPLKGEQMRGKVVLTLYGGRVVYRDEGYKNE
jgi:dihydroorotase